MISEQGKYFKCSRYEFSDGFIRPATGADVLTYDLWRAYADPPVAGWSIEVPYRQSLQVAAHLQRTPPVWADDGSGLMLPAEQRAELASMVSRFGLFGVLPAQAESIVVPPLDGKAAVRQFNKRIGLWFDDGAAPGTVVGFDNMEWGDAGWASPSDRSRELAGSPLMLPSSVIPDAGGWLTSNWEPIDDLMGTFFPRLRSASEIPLPGTNAFWQTYSEPVFLVVTILWSFLSAVEILTAPEGVHSEARRQSALDFLQVLAADEHVSTRVSGSSYVDEHQSPGLISAYCAMFLRDWKANRRVVHCQTCETIFITDDTRAKFCSERCRKTMLMRRYRGAKKITTQEP